MAQILGLSVGVGRLGVLGFRGVWGLGFRVEAELQIGKLLLRRVCGLVHFVFGGCFGSTNAEVGIITNRRSL